MNNPLQNNMNEEERGGGFPESNNTQMRNVDTPVSSPFPFPFPLIQPSFMDSIKLPNTNVSQIFSSPFGLVAWFFGLKWYVILFLIVVGMFLYFQIESAIETRKKKRNTKNDSKQKKEGMQSATVERMKGIIKDSENSMKRDISKKNVSFDDAAKPSTEPMSDISSQPVLYPLNFRQEGKNVGGFYDLWIRPMVYTIFRNLGIR
jgi:hypothetical protein